MNITGPSHGGSSARTEAFTLEDCALASLEVLHALDIRGPVDWVGCAWGGHVGITLAAGHPDAVRTLASFNAPVAALTADEARQARLLVRVLASVGAIRPAVDGVTRALLSRATTHRDPEAAAYVAGCLKAADPRALVCAIREISLGRPDLTPLLPEVGAPALFVTGDDDPLWSPAQAAAAAESLPDGESAVVAGTRHLTPFEDPAASVMLLRELWERAPN